LANPFTQAVQPMPATTTRLLAFLFLLITANVASGQFKVQFSEPLAVSEFVNHITSNSRPNPYKAVFDSSKYNNEKYKALLTKFEAINYFYWYEYPQYPYGNKIGGNTYFLLNKNLIESKSIEEFESKSFGIIPNADLAAFSDVLKAFLPVYREIIFEPNKASLKKQITQLNQKIKETDIGSVIEKVKKFHNSSWDSSKPFILNVCPTKAGNGINATAFFNYAYVNLPANQNDMELILSVMFHESFHIIYDEQSLEFKKEFAGWFDSNSSKYSRYAELLFNEAITTALSSGYLYSTLKKAPMPPEKWYNNKYIRSMAIEIYPLTLKYLHEDKTIDKSFVDEYIRLYESKFPGWITDIDNLLGDRFIICEGKQAYRAISKSFRYRNIDENADELTAQNLQKMKSLPITKLIILPKNDQQQSIALIKQTFPELKDWAPAVDSDFSYSTFLPDKTYLIIVNPVTKPAVDILKGMKFE
jgi:hypothetical protein